VKVLAVDPSIAKPAAAVLMTQHCPAASRRDPRGWLRAAHAYQMTAQFTTATDDTSLHRCGLIGAWATGLIHDHRIDVVVVEVPSDHGGYDRTRLAQRSRKDLAAEPLAKLNRSIGAIACAAASRGARLVELRVVDAVAERQTGTVAAALQMASEVDRTLARELVTKYCGQATHGKAVRHRILRSLLEAAGRSVPAQEDRRDATWLGLQFLTEEWSRS
jgi:hypothetical protein